MFVHLSIHRPIPGKEQDLAAALRGIGRDGEAVPGLHEVRTLRDRETGMLVALAIWESEDAFRDGLPALEAAVEGDEVLEREQGLPEVYVLEPV